MAKKFTFLSIGLLLSGALNIGLLALFFVTAANKAEAPVAEAPAMFASMENKSFQELVAYLTNPEKRDMALAALVAFHQFNLEKMPVTDEEFEAVVRYAYQEKWPYTARGLYLQLQRQPDDENLKQAFLSHPECIALQNLLPKSELPKSALQVTMHTVIEGETLWKIARMYQVKVDDLIKVNDLERDCLYPGMTLKVPDQSRLDEKGGTYKSAGQ